jgi:hypothetical protein
MRRARLRKTIRNRNKDHLAFVAAQPCLICQRTPCDAHHLKFAQPRSLGRKVSDEFTVPLRREYHALHCHGSEVAWWVDRGARRLVDQARAGETSAREGMVVNEDLILEIVRPGTGDPVSEGDVGEIVVTPLDLHHLWIRLALGDLTAALPGLSPCGRSNMRIKGWMGRADQTTKVKGMFVRPAQIAEIGKRHPELGRLRLVVTREGETDVMTLKAETKVHDGTFREAVTATLRSVTKLTGTVAWVTPQSLPNDGKVIADERG